MDKVPTSQVGYVVDKNDGLYVLLKKTFIHLLYRENYIFIKIYIIIEVQYN